VFERARPVLALMGRTITRVGDTGDGQTCKVANQIVVALTINAVAEGLLFLPRAPAPTRPGCAKPCSAAWPARASSTSWASA